MTDEKATKDAVFGALAVMEEAGRVIAELQNTADKALREIPGEVEAGIVSGMGKVLRSMDEATRAALEAEVALRAGNARLMRLGGLLTGFIVAVGIVVAAAVWGVVTWSVSSQRQEVVELEKQLKTGHAALAAMEEATTWGLELGSADGKYWITLPHGVQFGDFAQFNDGRQAVWIIRRGKK